MYTTLSVDKILKVLEEDVFKPKKNSAQKTIHNIVGHDPRHLRPESREDMDRRIRWLSISQKRHRRRSTPPPPYEEVVPDVKQEPSPPVHEITHDDRHPLPSWEHYTFAPPVVCHPEVAPYPESTLSPGLPPEQAGPELFFQHYNPHAVDSQSPSTVTDGSSHGETVRDLQNRISGCSTVYATQITTLLRKFTIASESDLPRVSPGSGDFNRPDPAALDCSFALPGEFFQASQYSTTCFHETVQEQCWCGVAEAVRSLDDFWVRDGELAPAIRSVVDGPTVAGLRSRDRFDNTPLHLVAGREGLEMQLLGMVLMLDGDDLSAANTGGQTFLHLLAPSWFSSLSHPHSPLSQLLTHLRSVAPDVVFVSDVYGRTFFHRLHSFVTDPIILASVMQHYKRAAISRRDAFGSKPLILPTPLTSPLGRSTLSPTVEEASPVPNEDALIRHHEGLLRIVTASDNNPLVEDSEGRNGLHCLAQAIVDTKRIQELATGKRGLKRKMDQNGGVLAEESELGTRLRLVRGLLSRPLDVNHYDRQDGNTVLQAFITHIPDEQEDKARNLTAIFEALLAAGAHIEARNRLGETALLLAARLGRKIALSCLLEHGANVHARDSRGRGMLALLDELCFEAASLPLYGRLEACRVILTSKRQARRGVKIAPTLMDEWGASDDRRTRRV